VWLDRVLLLSQALGDNLDVTAVVDEIPLARDAQGAFRVGGTRITLDLVVRAFNRGATAEEIVQKYCSLQLSDVYQVIGYYLKHADDWLSTLKLARGTRRQCLPLIRSGRQRAFEIAYSPARSPSEMACGRVF